MRIVTATTSARLIDAFAEAIAAPHSDPFGRDIVVVPSVGMREYLLEQLSRRMPGGAAAGSIVANLSFIFPSEFNLQLLGYRRPDDDVWRPNRLRWTVLDILQREPSLLPGFAEGKRQLARAQKAARLLDTYATQRPAMVNQWAKGLLTDGTASLDAAKRAAYGWQFEVWRKVRARLGPSHAELLIDRAPSIEPNVRYWLFGLEFMSPSKLGLLSALGADAPVGMFLLQPVGTAAALADVPHPPDDVVLGGSLPRADFKGGALRQPLNRSWGPIATETAAVVQTFARHSGTPIEQLAGSTTNTLLGRVQRGITSDEPDVATTPLADDDRSVQLHFCHGPSRQVQVLRDALLHLFNNDPTLHPRDVLVLCNDLPTFAPLIEPTFSSGDVTIPVTIADRSFGVGSNVDRAIDAILTVLHGRCTASEMLDVISNPVVHASVDLSTDELPLLWSMLDRVDLRWGLNGEHRAAHGYELGDDFSTWRHAVDRMLLGALVRDTRRVHAVDGITPLDDVDSQSATAAGKLSVLVSRLESIAAACEKAHTASEWSEVLTRLLGDLIEVSFNDRSQLFGLRSLAAELNDAGTANPLLTLSFAEFCDAVRSTMDTVAPRSRVWADTVRVATPQRYRGVPSRVIVLLGMDEERIRSTGVDGDDLLAATPHIGDRDARQEARLGLLTSICSTGETLMLFANGHDVTDNTEVAPAMPVRELIDHLAALCDLDTNGPLPFVVHHSRQATDIVNLGVDHYDGPKKNVYRFINGPWSFDRSAVDVARQISNAPARTDLPTMPVPLDPPTEEEVESSVTIADLVRAMRRPAETFLQRRLRIRIPSRRESLDELLPLWIAGLDEWAVGDGVLTASLDEVDIDEWIEARRLDGGVPPGALGDAFLSTVRATAESLNAAVGDARSLTPEHRRIDIAIDGHRWVLGDVVTVHGSTLLRPMYSTAAPHRRYQPLIELAAITAADPSTPWVARIVARKETAAEVEAFSIAGSDDIERQQNAMAVLAYAGAMLDRALRAPVLSLEETNWVARDSTVTAARTAFDHDRSNGAFGWLFPGDLNLTWLRSIASGPLEDGLPDGPNAAARYASGLQELWRQRIVVHAPTDAESAQPEESHHV